MSDFWVNSTLAKSLTKRALCDLDERFRKNFERTWQRYIPPGLDPVTGLRPAVLGQVGLVVFQ